MAWTNEQKQQVIDKYLESNPTAETSVEIIKEIAEEFSQSANGVRMILVQAGVYVKKEAAGTTTTSPKTGETKTGEGTKRVSKEAAITSLTQAITNVGGVVDLEILEKLTGKAALYLASVINGIASDE